MHVFWMTRLFFQQWALSRVEYGPCRTQSKAMNHSWITYFSCPKRTRVLQQIQPSCFLRGWQEYYIFKILNRAADQHRCKCQPFSLAVVIKVVSLETFRDQQRCNMMVASRFNSGHARVLTNVWSQSSFPCVCIAKKRVSPSLRKPKICIQLL